MQWTEVHFTVTKYGTAINVENANKGKTGSSGPEKGLDFTRKSASELPSQNLVRTKGVSSAQAAPASDMSDLSKTRGKHMQADYDSSQAKRSRTDPNQSQNVQGTQPYSANEPGSELCNHSENQSDGTPTPSLRQQLLPGPFDMLDFEISREEGRADEYLINARFAPIGTVPVGPYASDWDGSLGDSRSGKRLPPEMCYKGDIESSAQTKELAVMGIDPRNVLGVVPLRPLDRITEDTTWATVQDSFDEEYAKIASYGANKNFKVPEAPVGHFSDPTARESWVTGMRNSQSLIAKSTQLCSSPMS